ncbi:MAG TPA: SGNH family hydrolase [Xanthobacteraceae bacterium]|nr:SGNH family hydrolase [Xanthobacteraceae bacterium]
MLAITMLVLAPAPSNAQFFEFPFQNRRQRGPFDWFDPAPQQQPAPAPPPVDYTKAPAPKKPDSKAENTVTTPILVLGDSMADWLAYGLELAYAEAPEIGILRRHRTNSGLIRTEVRSDPRGEYPDWPPAARELIASQKPKFVLMMIGINDRRQIREAVQVAAASRPVKPALPRADDPAALELDKSSADKPNETPAAAAPESATPAGNRNLEFRSDAWSEAYIRRIDDTITALKTSGVPVFWVGLPPLRGQKSAADIPFLNELYRSRADKAGIIYIDVWDGFVDEEGRYAQSGPDVEGQIRRLRTSDGVYFTQAGARKLAHYIEREVQRWLSTRAAPVAVTIPEEPKVDPAVAGRPGSQVRPLAGPAVPLIAGRGSETDDLLGGNARQPPSDAMVTKVLVRGEPVQAPAGRADDFVWPRRGVAPVGSDPVVATTDLPMTPMLADRSAATTATAAAAPSGQSGGATAQAARRSAPRQTFAEMQQSQSIYRPDYRRPAAPPQFNFPSLFGGGPSLFGGPPLFGRR